jgi:hypothetical protein
MFPMQSIFVCLFFPNFKINIPFLAAGIQCMEQNGFGSLKLMGCLGTNTYKIIEKYLNSFVQGLKHSV